MRYPYFFCRRDQMWIDGWTYGDHRQYICRRPGGQTQCAKVSELTFFGFVLGLVLWLCLFVALWLTLLDPNLRIHWPRTTAMLILATLLVVPGILNLFGLYLMKAVGPYNDGARRVLPGEEKTRAQK